MYLGNCLCEAVKIKIKGQISDIIYCHCSLCRKNSGTAFATNGFINAKGFEITAGKDNLSQFSFKPGRNRHFCISCGSPVYSSNQRNPDRYRIRLGILDSNITERPISHNLVSSKANCKELEVKLPRYNSFESSRD